MGRTGVAVALALCLAACSSLTGQGAKNVRFVVSSFQMEGGKPADGAVDDAREGVTETLEGYANDVVLPSLRSGRPSRSTSGRSSAPPPAPGR